MLRDAGTIGLNKWEGVAFAALPVIPIPVSLTEKWSARSLPIRFYV